MKYLTTLLLTLLTLGTAHAQITLSSPQYYLPNRIAEITPAQGLPGDVITVRVARHPYLDATSWRYQLNFGGRPVIPRRPLTQTSRLPRIQFTRPDGGFADGRNITVLDGERYLVTVPDFARNGPMRLETVTGAYTGVFSPPSSPFTVIPCGYKIRNDNHFDIVSITVDGVPRILEPIAAVPSGSVSNEYILTTSPGPHDLVLTFGPIWYDPVLEISGEETATTALGPTAPYLAVPVANAGQFITLPGIAQETPSHSHWERTDKDLNGTPLAIFDYDFYYDPTTEITTWTRSAIFTSGVVEQLSGTLEEPAFWPANPTNMSLRLINSNGTVLETILYKPVTWELQAQLGTFSIPRP